MCFYSYTSSDKDINILNPSMGCVKFISYSVVSDDINFQYVSSDGSIKNNFIKNLIGDTIEMPVTSSIANIGDTISPIIDTGDTSQVTGGVLQSLVSIISDAYNGIVNSISSNSTVTNPTTNNQNNLNNTNLPTQNPSDIATLNNVDMNQLCGRKYPDPAYLSEGKYSGSGNIYTKRFVKGYDAEWPSGTILAFDAPYNGDTDATTYPQKKGEVYTIKIKIKDSDTSAGGYLYNISLFEGPAQDITFKKFSISKYPCDFSKTAEISRVWDQVPSIEFAINDPARDDIKNIAHLKSGIYYINFVNIDADGGSRVEMPSGAIGLDFSI